MKLILGLCAVCLLSISAHAYELTEISIPSQAMQRSHSASIVLPDAYRDGKRRFAVVYVLHGFGGDYRDWTGKSAIESLADQHELILVMPDGDQDKWYIDSEAVPASQYQTYVGKEVVAHIDKHFRTVANRRGRAITGLSMGGFGALNIALNYPDTFSAAGSMSGGVDVRGFADNWGLKTVFGDNKQHAAFWQQKMIVNNAGRFKTENISVIIDCGVEDIFIDVNRALHRKMLELNVPHDYIERAGGHDWPYWDNAVKYQVLYFATVFQPTAGH